MENAGLAQGEIGIFGLPARNLQISVDGRIDMERVGARVRDQSLNGRYSAGGVKRRNAADCFGRDLNLRAEECAIARSRAPPVPPKRRRARANAHRLARTRSGRLHTRLPRIRR